jgi:hypothetical protein
MTTRDAPQGGVCGAGAEHHRRNDDGVALRRKEEIKAGIIDKHFRTHTFGHCLVLNKEYDNMRSLKIIEARLIKNYWTPMIEGWECLNRTNVPESEKIPPNAPSDFVRSPPVVSGASLPPAPKGRIRAGGCSDVCPFGGVPQERVRPERSARATATLRDEAKPIPINDYIKLRCYVVRVGGKMKKFAYTRCGREEAMRKARAYVETLD